VGFTVTLAFSRCVDANIINMRLSPIYRFPHYGTLLSYRVARGKSDA
jgi:hypothetical protein